MRIKRRLVPGHPGYRATSEGTLETLWEEGKAAGKGYGQMPSRMSKKWRPVRVHVVRGRPRFNVPKAASGIGRPRGYFVHTFVCLAFHGIPTPGQEVRHFPDRNRTNNRPDNLIWGTHKENERDKLVHGTLLLGEKVPTAKLTNEQVEEIAKMILAGDFLHLIAARMGVEPSTIHSIKHGRTWSHLTGFRRAA